MDLNLQKLSKNKNLKIVLIGKWLGVLAKDGALTVIGAAGGLTAGKTMPRLEEVLTNKSNNIKQIARENAYLLTCR